MSLNRRVSVLATSLLVIILALAVASSATAAPPDNVPDPRGQAAIDRLGDHLPEIARGYGLTPEGLRSRLLSDNSLSVDAGLQLFYVDPAYDPSPASASEPASSEAPQTTDLVFALHSRPGANHVIYLDFDGHTTTGTVWNNNYGVSSIVSPAYDIDGDPNSWSAAELSRIGDTWKIVAEDFAPFDIDVTTEEPPVDQLIRSGGGDTQWGIRVLTTDDTFAGCGCGGHAYINSFNYSTDTPVFVYNSSLLGVAEAASHEVGHSVGLSHDGTSGTTYYSGHGSGEESWAPIMGVGYYEAVTQWSKGEYYQSNNAGNGSNYGDGPDDLVIMTTQFGFGYRPDDHGNSSGAASILAGTSVSESGLIGQSYDVDVFGFSTDAGAVSLDIEPDPFRPNLNVKATLRDSSGNQVAASNPTSTLSASFDLSLAAGTYFLEVEGTGTGDPMSSSPTGYTEYGTLGQYTVTGTVTASTSNNSPTASFTHSVTDLTVVEFTDTSTDSDGTIASWSWDFGDSNTSTEQNPSHSYAIPGTKTVTLIVTDDDGATDTSIVNIPIALPVVQVTATDADAAEAGTETGAFTLTRTGGTAFALTVQLSLTGSANNGGDYQTILPSATIPTGSPSVVIIVTPIDDEEEEADETVNLTIMADAAYAVGAVASDSVTISSDDLPPTFVDHFALGDIAVAGTISGSYLSTQSNDGLAEGISERHSGGKPQNRHSFLEHKWSFDVRSANTITFFLNAWATDSGERESFIFSYSTDGLNFQDMLTVENFADSGADASYSLPDDTSGTVYVRVVDSDQVKGNNLSDRINVDSMFIRSEIGPGEPPAAPTDLHATEVSASEIDITWFHDSGDEYGFEIERSLDGDSWSVAGSVGSGVLQYSDTGLDSNTTYTYRVHSFNGSGDSGVSNTYSATTMAGSDIILSANGYKVKGVQHADVSWSGAIGDVDVYRDGVLLPAPSSGQYTDVIGNKGGGTYAYQVCDTATCSASVFVVF